jgi:voltage-gated sodium channel
MSRVKCIILINKDFQGVFLSLKAIRESAIFSNFTTSIIVIYAVILGFKTSAEVEHTFSHWWYYLDFAVTLYFLFEIVIKISADKTKFFKDSWNIFDFLIVVATLLPIEESEFAMIARLLRLFRVLRIFKARPELKNIIDMLIGAIPSIIDIVILMFIIFYIYGTIGSFLFGSLESGLWENLLVSMLTLFRVLTFEDWTDVMYEAMELSAWSWVFFVSFIIITAFVFFNLFVAVIIGEMERLREETKKAKEDACERESQLDRVERELGELKELVKSLKKE